MRFFGNFSRFIVTDMGVERGHQHQRLIEQLIYSFTVGLDSRRAMFIEAFHTVRQQAYRLQEVVDDHRSIDVELKVT